MQRFSFHKYFGVLNLFQNYITIKLHRAIHITSQDLNSSSCHRRRFLQKAHYSLIPQYQNHRHQRQHLS